MPAAKCYHLYLFFPGNEKREGEMRAEKSREEAASGLPNFSPEDLISMCCQGRRMLRLPQDTLSEVINTAKVTAGPA